MAVRLEHANLTVHDIEGMIRFLQTAFPGFQVRGEGRSNDGSRWVHIGTQETYIALSPAKGEPEQRWMPYHGLPGVNHLAYEVDDVEALCERMKSAGYKDSTPPNAHPYRKLSATITSCRIDSTSSKWATLYGIGWFAFSRRENI